jgi:hypothetical protein
LPQYLPVFEPGDDVLDAGPDPAVHAVVVVVDDPADVVAARCGDGRDAAISAVAEDDTIIEQLHHGVAGHDDVLAVAGPAAAPGYHDAAPACTDDDLGVDAAAVVLADGGDRRVEHRDQGAVDDPRVAAVVLGGTQCVGQHRHHVMNGPVHRRLAGVKQCGQCPGGQVGA